mmetsp:Transcript_3868/g.8877  ORF Transcript_3868/g.8877 Transcript_3868/m.8877 type:complete len:107 (-) Transcript_3868:250-570(-)
MADDAKTSYSTGFLQIQPYYQQFPSIIALCGSIGILIILKSVQSSPHFIHSIANERMNEFSLLSSVTVLSVFLFTVPPKSVAFNAIMSPVLDEDIPFPTNIPSRFP